jgi:hypothetical protein
LEAAPTSNYPVKATTPEHIANWDEFWWHQQLNLPQPTAPTAKKARDENVRKSRNVIVSVSITKTNSKGALGIQTNAKLKCTFKSY